MPEGHIFLATRAFEALLLTPVLEGSGEEH